MGLDRPLKKCQPLSIQSAQNAAAKHKERQTPLTLFLSLHGILQDIPVSIKKKRFWMREQITGCL